MGLTPEEEQVVQAAIRQGLISQQSPPRYLPASWCTLLSFVLVPPTLGFSLVVVPLLWVVQHDLTAHRITTLRQRLLGGDGAPLHQQPTEGSWT
jgi:hypothetical protein